MKGFLKVEFWNKAQKPVALISGAILIVLIIAIVGREFLPQLGSFINQGSKQTAQEEKPAADKPQTSTSDEADKPATEEKKPATTTNSDDDSGYTYTASAGDSYTSFARQAIAKYARDHRLVLTSDQALAGEIKLANDAGSPLLEIGEKVTIASTALAAVMPASEQKPVSTESTDIKPDKQADNSKAAYTYSATAGDTYTWFARDAVSQYIKTRSISLTPAQRAYAEAYIASEAGSPLLEIGQQVTIAHSAVQSAVDSARQLSADSQAGWQVYANSAAL